MSKNDSSARVQVSIRCPAYDIYDNFLMSQSAFKAIEWFLSKYNGCGDVAEFTAFANEKVVEELDI